MNRNKKIASGILSGILAASMVSPVLAATNTSSIIADTTRKGTLNIHKIVENDGTLKNADGLAVQTDAVEVDNVGFDYVKVADIDNITGIVVSENGKVVLAPGTTLSGEVQVGTYYIPNDNLAALMEAANAFPEPTYILRDAVYSPNGTLQHEYNDDVANSLLSAEQAGVDSAYDALVSAKNTLTTMQANSSVAASSANTAAANEANLAAATETARLANENAQTALSEATTAATNAQTAADNAASAARDASAAYDSAVATLEEKLANYDTGSESTLKLLQEAIENMREASNEASIAADNYDIATEKKAESANNLALAEEALVAAQEIFDAASAAHGDAANGTADSINGTANAVASAQEQLDNAQAYRDACFEADEAAQQALTDAEDALANAVSAAADAEQNLETATSNNDEARAAFEEAFAAMESAKAASDSANEAAEAAAKALEEANTAKNNAVVAAAEAEAAYNSLQEALDAATGTAGSTAESAAEAQRQLQMAQDAYNQAKANYNAAVAALDAKASQSGIVKVYTTEALEKAWQGILTTLSEKDITEWVALSSTGGATNTKSTYGKEAAGYTDDHGTVTFSGMDLGLYVVAETDISYHDGMAGAWNDGASGFINGDQMNTYSGDTYSITPLDAHLQGIQHTYQAGEVYHESYSPEAPILETPCAPFMVSLPTTNTADTANNTTAAGDQYGEKGTVWQYTVDVYPKNQTTAIYKRIVDPDEKDGYETLRTSEDYQIGDLIEQVIWADAPVLQKNFLFDASDEGFGQGLDGDLTDRFDLEESANKHVGYVISDNMTEGLTFDKITKVAIIPKSQLVGANQEITVYTNAEGALVSADEALENGQLKTETKYYDDTGKEISKETFEERAAVAGELAYYSDIDNNGAEVGNENNIYQAKDGYTGTYYAKRVSYKQAVVASGSVALPRTVDVLNEANSASDPHTNGEVLSASDYELIITDDAPVVLADTVGQVATVVEQGTHGWAVKLTQSGLDKLNARETDSVVVVYFDAILNKNAKIGEVSQNMNYPSLSWVNSNVGLIWDEAEGKFKAKTIGGNEVYDYTYELQIQKEGVVNGNNVKFVVSRDDTGDIAQVPEKDMTDSVSQMSFFNQVDSIRFVKEADGVYHVWSYLPGDRVDESDNGDAFETDVVNEVTYNVLTPAEDGKLIIKGLDSDSYIFQEIKTEDENNLLANTFTVKLEAADDAISSKRDGRIATATVTSGNSDPIDITIGCTGTTGNDEMTTGGLNRGIASMVVNNFDAVDLRTGGRGRTLIYICGVAMVAGLSVGLIVSKKKNKNAKED